SGAAATASNFSSCLVSNGVSNFSLPTSPSYAGLLNSSIFNLRFTLPNVAGPAAIVLPESRDDLRRAILCARARSLAIRVRSGGHSYEGLSYTTENHVPFVVVDLTNLNRVRVDPGSATAWAESGATAPISRHDMAEIVRHLSTGPTGSIQLDPYGGAMARVGSSETPFPHRAGYLYSIQYGVNWDRSQVAHAEEFIGWLGSFYRFMAPYVSKDPRAAYVNYLDLDLGVNNWTRAAGGSSAQAVARARSSWG
uniref:FAD-binding PCMH-type domain-containing protein n=1 Tax=Aegilops tauschii subsp. strangulata TaxID=200361 RepID=A0A453FZC7_AEGTS